MNRAPVAVIGASGQVGRFVLPLLVRDGWPVLALSRVGRPGDYPDLPRVEWLASGIELSAEPVRSLVSVGPVRLALECLSRNPDLERVVAVSSSSVLSKTDSPDAAERSLVAELARTEQALLGLCAERGIACTVLRPTLIYGAGMDDNLTRLWRWIVRRGWLPLASNAGGLRQPLHAQDLAEACVRALLRPGTQPLVSPLCGGSTLTYREMVERLFEAAGRPVRILTLPTGLLGSAVALAAKTPWLRGANPEMVRRQAVDLVFDDRVARDRLGVKPRPFEPSPVDFRPPTVANPGVRDDESGRAKMLK